MNLCQTIQNALDITLGNDHTASIPYFLCLFYSYSIVF
jgi:hypothetical protein